VGPPAAVTTASSTNISPTADTYLNLNAENNATKDSLNLYTWPDNKIANAIVMKFDLASIPVGSTISSATLNLSLRSSDATADPTYTVTVHKIVNHNPDLTSATGYTYDGVHSWTPNTCCFNNVPLAQADIGPAVDTRSIDKTAGFKQWDVTSLVQGWFSNPSTNFGLLVNSDPSKLADRWRVFWSTESAGQHPYLTVVYTPPTLGDVVFESNWSTALGTSDAAIRDGGRWDAADDAGNNPGAGGPIMEVVSGGPQGYANALRIQQRGGCDNCWANVRQDDFLPQSTDFYVRYYMRNDDTSHAGDHVVTVDFQKYVNLTYMRKERWGSGPTEWYFLISHHAFLEPTSGCTLDSDPNNYLWYHSSPWNADVGVATPPQLVLGQWYRFEYFVHFTSDTSMQVYPRVYDASGALLFDDRDFRQQEYNPDKPGQDQTLASYYAAGNDFCVDPTAMNDFDMGNNSQGGADSTGLYWYYAGVQIRTGGWPGQ